MPETANAALGPCNKASHAVYPSILSDQLSLLCRAAGLASTSVNFGPVAEVGMAASHAASLQGMGLQGLPPKQVSDAFQQAGYAPRHVSARLMLSQFSKVNTAKGKWALLDNLMTTSSDTDATASFSADSSRISPGLQTAKDVLSSGGGGLSSFVADAIPAPRMGMADIEQLVRRTAAEALGEEMSSDGRFASSHFDSLAAVELSNSIGKAVGLDLPGTLVFDYPSAAEVAKHLSTRMMAQSPGPDTSARELASVPAHSPTQIVPGFAGPTTMLMGIRIAHRIPGVTAESLNSSLGTCSGGVVCKDGIARVPYDRWDLEAPRAGKSVMRAGFGAFLGNVSMFDASLFSITGPEADLMDPQQRLLLGASWEVMGAGAVTSGSAARPEIPQASMQRGMDDTNMGVWIGIQQMEYGNLAAQHLTTMGAFSATGMPFSVAAGRISFTYGLKGPAVSPPPPPPPPPAAPLSSLDHC